MLTRWDVLTGGALQAPPLSDGIRYAPGLHYLLTTPEQDNRHVQVRSS